VKKLWYLAGGILGAGIGYLVFVLGICATGNLLTKDPSKTRPGTALLLLSMFVFATASMLLVAWFRREYVD
jgi:hypothetical protein